ncbi:hypothetical protein TNIN_92961, partial [Trichonephila inaurata madagascariensis]
LLKSYVSKTVPKNELPDRKLERLQNGGLPSY